MPDSIDKLAGARRRERAILTFRCGFQSVSPGNSKMWELVGGKVPSDADWIRRRLGTGTAGATVNVEVQLLPIILHGLADLLEGDVTVGGNLTHVYEWIDGLHVTVQGVDPPSNPGK